jgi:pimeloyl-ACP methyl ester carboxylesterase
MNRAEFTAQQKITATPSGRIAYVEQGDGPAAVFLHGILLNKYFWRHQLAELRSMRRCIALDLLAHGTTEITPESDTGGIVSNGERNLSAYRKLQQDTYVQNRPQWLQQLLKLRPDC